MKRQALAFEPVARAFAARAVEAFLYRYGEQKRQVGDNPSARHSVELQHHLLVQPPPERLVRRRGIEKPIAKNVDARFQSRPNHLAHVLRSRRLVEQEFRGGIQSLIAWSEQ